jgi:hypothetical protein
MTKRALAERLNAAYSAVLSVMNMKATDGMA